MNKIATKSTSALPIRAIIVAIFVVALHDVYSQNEPAQINRKSLLKAGLFVLPRGQMPELSSLHLELEIPWRRRGFMTSGPRLDYLSPMGDTQENLFVGYELKLYPLFWKSQKSFQGPFIGVAPMVLLNTRADRTSRYGPGIAPLAGYQQVIRERYSISLEGGLPYVQDLNNKPAMHNPEGRYFYIFLNFKLGVKL